jgi:hypothetical protein
MPSWAAKKSVVPIFVRDDGSESPDKLMFLTIAGPDDATAVWGGVKPINVGITAANTSGLVNFVIEPRLITHIPSRDRRTSATHDEMAAGSRVIDASQLTPRT